MVACIFIFKGTIDSGDSIMHYFFARYAFVHPASFFDTWAKPLYVALASPFARLGFNGIKLFNVICNTLSMLAAYMVAKKLEIKNSWLVPVLMLLSPLNFALSFSGLTEPLFALVLIGGLCFLFYDKQNTGLIILSFLPFARSEGMFMLMIIAVYLVINKRYLKIGLLATGQVLYAIIGYFHFKDLLWFYHNNPYGVVSSYGNGSWMDYFNDLPLIAGYLTWILLGAGVILIPINFLKKTGNHNKWNLLLLCCMFLAYFCFHEISWTFGLFASFGMSRIIIGVMPLIAVISVYGLNGILALLKPGIIQSIKTEYDAIKPQWIAYGVLVLFGSMFGLMALANHYFFRSTTFDYGPYNYAFWDYAHFHLTPCPMYKVFNSTDINFLQDHFSLLLMFLVPFYWLMNWLSGTYTLLILQTLFIVWGGWGVFKLVELKTKDTWLGALAVLYYFLLQGRYSAFDEDCNIIIMASCFVPVFLWYFESGRYKTAMAVFILAVFSREDMSLWFVFIALMVMVWHRKEKKLAFASLAYMVASIVVFILMFKVFIPAVQSPDRKYDLFTYSALGDTPYKALLFIIGHPIDSFSMLFINQSGNPQYDSVKMEFYMVYLVSGGFVLFLRPKYFIWFIPLIAQKMFNDEPIRWSIESYYTVQVATLLPIPVFLILAEENKKIYRYGLGVMVCAMALTVTLYDNNPYNRKLGYTESVKRNIFNSKFFLPDYQTIEMHKDLKLIPKDAPVSASASVLPHLAQRKGIYEFPDVKDAQYIAAFTTPDYYGMPAEQYVQQLMSDYVFNPGWSIIAYNAPLIVMKKGGAQQTGNYDSASCGAEVITADGKHLPGTNNSLFDIDSATWNTEHVRTGTHAVKLTKDKAFGMILHLDNAEAGDFVMASVWRYGDNKGALVASAGSTFNIPTSVSVAKDSAGWEKLVLFFVVPNNHQGLGIYAWNNNDNPAWFDDMTVKRFSIKK